MKNIKYLVFTLLLFGIFNCSISADTTCSADEIARLKKLAENVTVTYEYDESDDYFVNRYNVSVNGLTDEIYGFINESSDNLVNFYYGTRDEDDVVRNFVFAGKLDFYIYPVNCSGEKLRKISLSLPYYNEYYTYDECKGISGDELDVCNKFIDKKITYDYFLSEVKKYKDNNFVNVGNNAYMKYLYVVVVAIVVIGLGVFIFIRHKRNKLD